MNKIIKWFADLTRQNWGLPWHLWITSLVAILCYGVIEHFLWFRTDTLWVIIAAVMATMFIGYVNEVIDRDQDPSEFWQDMAANFIGAWSGIGAIQAFIALTG